MTTRLRRGTAQTVMEKDGDIAITPKSGRTANVTGLSTIGKVVLLGTKTALTPGATVAIDSTLGSFFTLTPGEAETINATVVGVSGQILVIKILTSGVSSFVLTFGTNFKSTGTLATGTTTAKVFQIAFLSDGTTYNELFRTAAM